ncbi:MAG: UvrD-helicase domain-containing protein, partial [Verrucomicrobiota bacterium]|nr:UvrD-helicase domain-containing protein [Verrucomicrobiota bacterium]
MPAPPPFHLLDTPLTPGRTLIEASAGTGKTYTIAGLFLRLLVEVPELEVRQILVTTYTEIATAELRDRIRALLRDTLAAYASGSSHEPFISAFLEHHRPDLARPRLESALRDFDEAAIQTMHGFCHRALQDRALESGLPFDAELVTDQSELLREVADDYWRIQFYPDAPYLTALALARDFTPQTFARLLQETINHPRLTTLPEVSEAEFEELKEQLCDCFAQLREWWSRDEPVIRKCLLGQKWYKAQGSYRPDAFAQLVDEAGKCLSAACAAPAHFSALAKLASGELGKATLKNARTPEHPFFQLCKTLAQRSQRYLLAVQAWFLQWARTEVERRRAQRNELSFDDLLTRLEAALSGPSGALLTRLLRARFRAALIDEFQDTDPVQERIFDRIFGEDTIIASNADGDASGVPPASDRFLFLIGDPKQAIYGFRGADVFTYLRAAARVRA